MKKDFHYICPKCKSETTIHDYLENETFVFCDCEIDGHGDGVIMELQNPPSTRAFWSVKIDFEIGERTEPTSEELEQIAELIKQGRTGGEFESEECYGTN